jgi:hypothetical protein
MFDAVNELRHEREITSIDPRQNNTSDAMLRTSLIGALFAAASFTALAAGIERDAMDTSTAPGDDFWTYANGAWVKEHPIPADRSSYGVDAILTEETNKRTVDLIQAAAQNAKPAPMRRRSATTTPPSWTNPASNRKA